jgi:Transport and Golgi organisation 2
MCTVVISIEPGEPVLLAGVRDELTDRPWEPPKAHWPAYPDLIGGRDLQAGGTWLAVMPSPPRVSCVLNGVGVMAPTATRRSRGELPLLGASGSGTLPLAGHAAEPAAARALADYDPFHLLVAEPDCAVLWTWDGVEQTEHLLLPGLHLIVNSGSASKLREVSEIARQPGADQTGPDRPGPDRTLSGQTGADWDEPEWRGAPPPDGREHELARTAYFLGRFLSATRPDPRPGQEVRQAWGAWFPLVNGDGIGPDDPRALIVRRDLGGGRTWGTTSISLVALARGWLRCDFTSRPGDPSSWYEVL